MDNIFELKIKAGDLRITPDGQREFFDGINWNIVPTNTLNTISSNQLIYDDNSNINASISIPEPSYNFVLEMISKLSLEELQRLYAKKDHLITMIEKLILLKN